MTKEQIAIPLFGFTAILSFLVVLIQLLKGDGANAIFLGTGALFLILMVAALKRKRKSGGL